MNKPAIVALIKVLLKYLRLLLLSLKRATSLRRFGAIPPKPPIKIAIELKLANHEVQSNNRFSFSVNTIAESGCKYLQIQGNLRIR